MPSDHDPAQRRIGVREFRSNLPTLLREVQGGASLLITSHDEVLAELHPPAASLRAPRRPGALRGQIHMADDFGTLPEDVLAAMEG